MAESGRMALIFTPSSRRFIVLARILFMKDDGAAIASHRGNQLAIGDHR
jgi:hypothetical protein